MAGLCHGLVGASPALAADTLPFVSHSSQAGIKVELRIEGERPGPMPLEQNLSLTLDIRDEAGNLPLRGLRPRLWLSRQTADPPEACDALVRRFASGRISQRADRDLNSFQFATLNADASISFINPLVQLNSTKLEAIVPLPGPASEWIAVPGRDLLLVSLPEQGKLAVVDTSRLKLLKTITLPAGRPGKLFGGRDSRHVWVLTDQPARVVEIDLNRLEAGTSIALDASPLAAAIDPDGHRLLVASRDSGALSLLDLRAGSRIGGPALRDRPTAVTYSPLSRRFYAASLDGTISVIEPEHGRIETTLNGPVGLTALRSDPAGSYVLGTSPSASRLVAIDTARNKVLGNVQTTIRADQIAYTQRYAYLMSRESTQISLVDLKGLGEGRIASNDVPVFQKPAGTVSDGSGAELMAPSPEGDGMVIAGQADTALYYYTEGMMAPQGSYRTYSRTPRALLVIDRSLREVAPGRYTGNLRLDRGGRYSIPLLIQNPRFVQCFDFKADDIGATSAGRRLDVSFRVGPEGAGQPAARAGLPTDFHITVSDSSTGKPVTGLRDLQLMALEMPGLSQQRQFATETAIPGVYLARMQLWRPGLWRLQVQSQAQGLGFDRSPTLEFKVQPGPSAATTGSDAAPTPAQPAASDPRS